MAADFIAGTLGGVAGVLVGHPFDTVKVRLQTQSSTAPKYSGAFNCCIKIVQQESVFGLFKGMASPLVGLTFINALLFGVQGNMQRQFDKPSLHSHFISGSVAGFVQSFISGPMELAKIKVQIQGKERKGKYHGSIDALRQIYRMEGVRGCYRGLMLTIARDTPGLGIYFMSYELYCSELAKLDADGQIGITGLLVAGGLSGMSSWILTYSFDVFKTRLQADGLDGKNKYKGSIDVIRKSIRKEGIRVINKGLGTTLLRAFPTNAAIFTCATLSLELMGQTNNSNGRQG
ncbi:mitochondrial basic amino acids transporter [Strongylocentrotus purpuratus]|uniref:Mitochondrial basic amino acids transporter n=1 Tax=Strongylocentrotus purpuratus TaxID=7668 RepID=A0A7M7RCV6_STRPU|nr:mitochondrial basic amino acids transporter [Strongylocentrotus purpuratus]|eukprot:XP_790209.1 PREDICTED: mitochondrial basic amino acids transporter [Strongylocentrotus purpuratus]